MSDLVAQISLKLLDEISGPLKKITENLDKVGNVGGVEKVSKEIDSASNSVKSLEGEIVKVGEKVPANIGKITTESEKGTKSVSRLAMAMGKLKSNLGNFKLNLGGINHAATHFNEKIEQGIGKAFGAAAAGFGLVEPVRHAAEYDNTIRHVGIGLDLHGSELDKFTEQLGLQMQELARATGQSSEKLVDAVGFFGREGYKQKDIDAIMPTIAKISTAYNSDPEAVAKSTFAFQENMGIKNNDLPQALASMAVAGKLADLPFEKLAPLFPQLASSAGAMGIKGLSGSRDLLAELAVVRKSSGTEGEAVTNLKQLMEDVGQKTFGASMKKHGVDSYAVMANARKNGENPLIAILNVLDKLTKGGTDKKMLAEFIHNQQAALAYNALTGHQDQVKDIRGKLEKVDSGVIDRDYADGSKTLKIQMQRFDEAMSQLTRRLGVDFAPVLAKVTSALLAVEKAFEYLDKVFPKFTPILLGVGAGFLAITAVMAALGAVIPAIIAGISLLGTILGVILSPIGIVVAAIAAVGFIAYEAYKHFDVLKKGFLDFFHFITDIVMHPIKSMKKLATLEMDVAKSGASKVSHWYNGLRGDGKIMQSPKLGGKSTVPEWMRHYNPNAPHKPAEVHVKISHDKDMKVSATSRHSHVKTSLNPGRAVGLA